LLVFLVVLVSCSEEMQTSTSVSEEDIMKYCGDPVPDYCTAEYVQEQKMKEQDEIVNAPAGGDVYQVVMEGNEFMPVDLEVKVGEKVEWVNKDSTDHTVTFENGDFDELLPSGSTVMYTFSETGTYRYFCQFHPGMQGSVIVS